MENSEIGSIKIVSGGQTGVDRGALDAALAAGVACGGWCPEGRLAEDGRIPARYPVIELIGGHYQQRTMKNLEDSDGTLIIYFESLSGGTEQTLAGCIERKRPYLLLDGSEIGVDRAVARVRRFLDDYHVRVLNVAGPRASGEPRAYGYAFSIVSAVVLPSPQKRTPAPGSGG
ncbi:MAG: putative molybdenum carrier protein [Gammaproteobacteria bacterium]|nr:putative molybdenum carrier protein [Gammaproteobacteria bacterium]